MTATHYDALGVAPSASLEEIRFAYRRLARIVHPDRHHGRVLGETAALRAAMAEINEAWAVLSDPGRRQAYDESLGLTEGDTAAAHRLAAKPAGRTLGTARATRAWASAATLTAPPTRRLLALLGAAALAAGAWQLRTVVSPATAPVGQRSGPG
ncbi:MAG: J domain-containing protein, partial [Actinomycetota bacterium]|nr:J domain-containing protein [Actinomycetota bacterium]